MGVKSNCKDVVNQLQKVPALIEQQLLLQLDIVGNKAVSIVRATKNYQDQTGNLSASIGYGVVCRGKLVSSGGFGIGKGAEHGRQALLDCASLLKQDTGVIIVAGEEYAVYVERKGFVVLDVARVRMDNLLQEALQNIEIKL